MNKKQTLARTNRIYDSPFDLYKKTITTDKSGIQKEKWKKKYHLYGKISNLYGREYELARQIEDVKTIKITTRYGAKITEDMMIKYNNDCYDIENLDNIKYENQEIEIRAVLRGFVDVD